MDVGIIIGDVATTTSPREHLSQLFAQVEAAQRNGIRYLTIGQHFLYGSQRWLQPVPTLARLAGEVSENTRLVTTVLQVPLRHPVDLAEDLATLDIVTAGRLIIGVGLGYRRAEFDAFGVPFEERVSRFEESLEVMTAMWQSPKIDHRGRHFTVRGETHITPWQDPHPPIWVGAQVEAGVRRSARLGDAWPIGPNSTLEEIEGLLEIYRDGRAARGLATGPQPLRRDVAFGPTREAALQGFLDRAEDRLRLYANNDLAALRGRSIAASVADHLVYGTPDQCVEQVQAIAARVHIDPLIVRPHWPGMSSDDIIRYIDEVGAIVPALAEL